MVSSSRNTEAISSPTGSAIFVYLPIVVIVNEISVWSVVVVFFPIQESSFTKRREGDRIMGITNGNNI